MRLAAGGCARVEIAGEVIAAVEQVASRGDEMLCLPAFIDTHVHLDKALIRPQLREHDGSLAGAITAIHERKRAYTVEDVRARARAAIESGVLTGTTRFRSHVDVDTIGGLMPLEGVMAAAADCAQIAEVRTIAFPQEGILRDPGALALMEAALEAGADLVGGMPHWERTDEERQEHVRLCFELAERFDRDLDMHVDETDDGSVRTLEMVADEALRRGWQGRVTVGHVCSLAATDEVYAARVIGKCARAGMTVVSNPVTNLVIQGRQDRGLIRRGTTRVAELRAAGVNVCFGQDCISDGFYPFGRGDMLEVALISAHATHLATHDDLLFALEAVTSAPARSWRIGDHAVAPGARADLVLYEAGSWSEALRLQRPPREVWFRGRMVAENRVTSRLLAGAAPAAAPSSPDPHS
ncbi:MAG: amidohydrolase family protein [Candidatus Dormibacterales bacterium]